MTLMCVDTILVIDYWLIILTGGWEVASGRLYGVSLYGTGGRVSDPEVSPTRLWPQRRRLSNPRVMLSSLCHK